MTSAKTLGLLAFLAFGLFCEAIPLGIYAAAPPIVSNITDPWILWGGNLENTRYANKETILNKTNIVSLKNLRRYITTGDTSATPIITSDGTLIIPDWAGYLYAFDINSATIKWKIAVASYVPGSSSVVNATNFIISRTSPALSSDQGTMVIGTQNPSSGGLAYVIAVNVTNGAKIWSTQLSTHPAAIVTQSALIYGQSVFVGVSSGEENSAALIPGYVCCTFQGTFHSINMQTGAIQWTFNVLPNNNGSADGYSGGAVWGSTPTIDKVRKTVYITTGNNYNIPASVTACVNSTTVTAMKLACYSPDNHIDSILSLDISTGAIKWSRRLTAMDAYTNACNKNYKTNPQNCPSLQGDDDDFSQGAMLVSICNTSTTQPPTTNCPVKMDIVVGFQKNGFIGAYLADNGNQTWYTNSVGNNKTGGAAWGSATDGMLAYISNPNIRSNNITLVKPSAGSLIKTNGGFAAAIDLRNGAIVWQTANPTMASNTAPVTLSNGVVYWPSLDTKGHVFMLDASTGKIINGHQYLGIKTNSGPVIIQGNIFLGSGYNRGNPGVGGAPGVFAIGL